MGKQNVNILNSYMKSSIDLPSNCSNHATFLIKFYYFYTHLYLWSALEGLAQWSTGEACFAPVPSSTLHVHACHPHGALPVYWACRMFSRPRE